MENRSEKELIEMQKENHILIMDNFLNGLFIYLGLFSCIIDMVTLLIDINMPFLIIKIYGHETGWYIYIIWLSISIAWIIIIKVYSKVYYKNHEKIILKYFIEKAKDNLEDYVNMIKDMEERFNKL